MAKTYKVIVNTGKEKADPTIEVVQGAGDRGQPVRIKAQAGAKYQLQELDRKKQVAPDGVKVKRVGKDLWVLFEEESQPSLILEDYYDVMPEGHNGVVGQAEDGLFYEYIPEDPKLSGLVSELAEGGQAVNVALGGVEVSGVGAAAGAVAFPWLGALGVLAGVAGAGALAYQALKKDGTGNQAGDLASASDSGQSNTDNLTNNKTNLVVQGQATPGSTVDVLVKNSSGVVVYQGKVTADADGNFNYTVPGPLPDGVYTPYTGETQGKSFTIDTVTNVDITDPGRVGTLSPISGTAEPGGTVVVKDVNGQVVGTVVANAQGLWQITPTTPVPAGAITAEVTDPAGNKANDSDMPVGLGVKTALSLDPISGDNVLLASESGATTLPVTGKVTGTFKEGDVVNVTLNGKNYAALVGADGRFSVPVSMADLKADPDTKIEATITGTNGDKATAAQDYTVEAGNTSTKTALSINPVTADNILSAAENTGSLAITGKVTGKYAAGDTVTLTVNGKTFTGAAAADGTYSINVPASDLSADKDTQIDGTVTGTGGTQASALQDYGVDNSKSASNKTALTLDPIAGDNVLLASEQGANAYNVTGKVSGKYAAGDVIELALNGKTYAATVAGDGSFSVPVSMADLKADPNTKIEATITGTDGDTATAAQDYNVEAGNTNTQTALSINPVTTDNILGASENTGNVAITGKVTGKYAAGDTVTLTVNGKAFTGAAAADGSYSIQVPAADLAADPDTQIDGSVTGSGGNKASALQDYALNSSAGGDRNATTTGDLAPGSDSGVPGDGITNDTTPTIIGQVPAGSTATITLNGKTYPVDVKPDGSYTFTQPDGLPDGTYTPVLNVTKNGETNSTPIYPFTIDTVPPSVAISADKIQLLAGQTSTITFTLSEAVTDFSAADITVSGGTLGNLVQSQTDPKVYTAVFTPNASSTTTSVISVASGRFSDVANNFNTDGAEANNTLNLPTNTQTPGGTIFLAPSSDSGAPGDHRTNDNTPTMTGQVPVGSTAVVSINGRDYPVSVKPDGSYTFTVPTGLPDGTYVPKIIITPAGSSTPNAPQDGTPFTIDTVAPTVLVSSDKATLATGQTATITFTLSEDSSDFTLADVTATGGTLSNLQGSGKSYTATFTPSAGSTTTSTVKVDSFKFSDAAGNFNTDGSDTGVGNTNIVSMPTNTAQADTTAPTIALSADRTSLATGQTTVVTFTLSEASSNFTLADVTFSGGNLGNLVQSQTDPKIYTAVFTSNAGSTTPSVISVASNKFSDAAGNQNTDGADANNTLSLPTNTMPAQTSGQLQPSSDSGTQGDNKTLDNTPAYGGTAPAGSQVEVVINGKTYTTVADSNGQYTVVVPDALPDGTYVPKIIVTPAGSSTPNAPQDGTPFTIDTTPPTVEVSSDKATLAAGQTATITFTLNEASSDFTLADVQVSGGTLSNFQGSGTSYTATFTPNAGSTDPSVVHVASNKFADAAGNANTDGAQSNNTVSMATNTMPADTTAPTIVVARTNAVANLKAGDTETITFTLSEASTNFNEGDVTVTGGTLSNFTAIPNSGTSATGYTQYTATFTPTANVASGSATVGVVAGKFSDNAGNTNQDDYNLSGAENANNRVSFSYNTTTPDTTPPTVALSRTGTGNLAAGGTEVINIVLSEASNNFDLSDIVVTGGTLSGFAPLASSGNASTGYTDYVVTFTPNANATGTATIGVASLKFSDAVGNNNLDTFVSGAGYEANNQVSLGYNTTVPDTTPPTVAVSRSGLGTVSSTETIYFTLSEASTDFALDDVTVNGGTLSGFTPVASSGSAANGYTQYQATFTPTANSSGLAAVGVVSGTFRDAAGNTNQDTFVSGVAGTVQEANNAVSFNVNTVLPDNTRPTVAVSRSGTGIVTGPETISFTLSESSTTFAADDISVTGGTLSGFAPVLTSGSVANGYTEYTATFTPASGTSGSATVGVASDKFADAAGNYNKDTFVANVAGTTQEVNNSVNFTYNSVAADTTPPTIAVERLGSGTLSANASETIRFTISEATKDFTLADIAVTGGTLSNLAAVPTSGTVGTGYTVYVATFTPAASASGQATIGVLSSKFSDAAGNLNQDTYTNPATAPAVFELNNKVDISYNTLTPSTDTTPPTVIVARAGSATLQTGGAETITFTLSEPSLSFELSDITVTGGGTLGALTMVTGSGTPATGYTVYTATYTPPANANSTTTIGVLSDKFTDAAGNLNKDTYQSGVLGTSVETNNLVSVAYNTTVADTTAPKVEVLRSASGTMTGPETIYFNFSEALNPGSFSLGDIVVSGGTMSNLVAVSGSNNTQFIATFTPNAASTGNATIAVGASAVTDVAGNANSDTYLLSGTHYEANNQVSAAFNTNANPTDTTPPTVAISRLGSGAVTSTETLVLVFSEPVNGFDASDIVVTANGSALASNQGVLGTVTEVAGSGGTQYTVSYTAPAGTVGSVTLGIKSATFTDRATAPNANQDTYEANVASTVQEDNNQITLTWDTDTTAPTVAVSRAGSGTLTGNNTDTITFTLSEASADFTQADVTTTGGTLSNWTRISATQYTATFTPTPNNSGTAAIGVRAGTFNDLGGNVNADDYTLTGAENTNNKVDIAFNTLGTTFTVNNDSASVNEDGAAITGNVKTNDSLVANVTSVSQGGTSGTVGVALPGTYGSLTLNADGSYTYAIDNTKAAVQALKAGQTVTEVFSYTGANTGATQSASANLTITITGTNDAPVAVADTASAVEAGGTANGSAGTNPTGNVLSNDTDVDTGDTKTVSAISGGTVGAAKSGTYGSLTLNADGSYSYALDNSNAAVQALLPSSTALTDTFTYTVRDGSNATSTATVTISITGANDAPQVQVALVDTTATTGSAFSYTFAGNNGNTTDTFRDVDTGHQTTLSYTASLADGSSLPSWLSFNATTRTFSGTPPVGTTPGNITVKVTATDSLGLTASDDFVIALAAGTDTTPPTIAVTSNQASLSAGQSATITFTFSEPVSGFVWDHLNPSASTNDIVVTGGTLGQLTQSGSDPKVYTATFTPTNNSTTAGSIGVRAGKFTDLATSPNANVDDYTLTGGANNNAENTNNLVTISVNTTVASGLTLINDTTTAKEAGVQNNSNTAEAGTNPSTTTQSAGVLGNDTAATSVTQIAASGGSNSAVSSGSTGASNGTTVTGQYGTLVMGANGTYTYTLSNTNGTVNALQAGSSLSDVFTYTATDGTTPKTANLTVTINGTNDAPTVALPLEDRTGIEIGNSVNYTFDSGTFADVDTADTKTYTATMADGSALPNWLTFDAADRNFSGTPPAIGVYTVKVIATDSRGATTSDEFIIDVIASRNVVIDDPKTALTIEPVTGDNVILNSENTGSITLTGQVTGTFVEGDIVTLLINGTNYTAAAAANGRYSVSVLASDLAADSDKQVIGSVNGTGGDLGTAAQRYVLETGNTATKTALSIDPVTADNVVLSSEAVAGKIAVTGKVTGVFATGDVVSLVIKNVTYTAAAAANGRFSVDVDLTDLQGDSDTIVNGTVTGTGGTVATALQDYALVDQTAPKIAITRSGSGTNTGAETITFTLSEASSNFVETDVDVTGGALSNWTAVSGTVYTATFTPTANSAGTASVGVTSGKFSDAAGNNNKDTYLSGVTDTTQESNNQVSFNYNTDTTPPTVAVTRAGSGTVSGTETITFTLSEASSDFTQADVFVTSGAGALSNWTAVSSTVYTATFTPTVNSAGSVTIGVASDRFVDAGGNLNKDTYLSGVSGATQEANNSVVFNYSTDITTPTVAVTRAGTGAVSGPETITFTLSEASTDFTQADVFVTSGAGTLTNWTAVSSTVYTATFTPTANSAASVTIGVASDKFADAAGNNNKDTYLSGVSGALQETNNAVIFDADTQAPTQTVTFSSMTKDSGLGTVSANNTSSNANWITADGSAGRLVSGAISANLAAGEVVEVYVNKGAGPVKIGNATVNGTHWAVTDHTSYVSDASWTYSAKVVDAAGNSGTTQTQAVTSDYVESAPVITAVVNSHNTTVPHNGASSTQTFTSISGTGNAGDVLVVVDNQYNNVVGTVVVGGNGQWSLTNLANISAGASNTFAAYQLDTHGNQSAYSNLYTVSTPFTTNFDGSFGTGSTIGAVPANYTIVANSPDVLTPQSGLFWNGTASPDGGSFLSVNAWNGFQEIISFNMNNLVVGQQYSIGFYQTATGMAQQDGSTGAAGSGYFRFTSGGTELGRSTDTGVVVKVTQQANGFAWTRETVTFTATGTSMTIAVEPTRTATDDARLALDGLTIAPAAVTPAVSALGGPTSSADSLTYTGGGLDGLAGADTITVSGTDLQTKLAAGGYINGGAAVDTLRLAAGTTLNLNTLMDNQTVGNLRELEIFQMQGTSTLTMSANDVLSLGGSNASTMSAYGFSSTSDGSGTGFNSTGKVQFVVNGTVTDTVNLTALAVDSVTGASGQFGNTGLSGQWSFIGTTTIGGVVYKVYNHSTTEAQVLVNNAVVNNATDTTPPTVAVTRSGTGDMSGAETITFTLSEGSSDFTESDVFVTSGAGVLSNWTTVSSRVYTATFTPAANSTGSVTIGVASDKFADSSANRNLDTYLSGVSGTTQEANNAVVFNRDTIAPTQTVTFSSMTKDTGLGTVTTTNTSSNANWTTADGSAGRLVSGSVSAALNAGEVVEVYVNKGDGAGAVKIGNATTNGTHWAVTDHTSYVANPFWTYSAKVVDAAGNSGTARTQDVLSDYVESAPVITSSTNTSNATVAHQGTTTVLLKTIAGTGNPGDTVFLVENTDTNVIGTATVGGNGQWSITLPGTLPGGANSYAAYQLDPHGNTSALSNVWQVNQNLPVDDGFNGSFGTTENWDFVVAGMTKVRGTPDLLIPGGNNMPANTISSPDGGAFYSAVGSSFASTGTNEQSSFRLNNLTVGGTYGMNFFQSVIGWDNTVIWNEPGNFEFYSGTTLLGSSDVMARRSTVNAWTADSVNFTATAATMDITIVVKSSNGSLTRLGMDGFSVQQVAGSSNADSTLVAGRLVGGPTTGGETLAFVDGALTGLAGNDTITVSSNQLQAKLAAGGYIDGDAGADTLRLAAGTVLDLDQMTRNQTVKSIHEVEIFQLQGGSTLTMSANDVLSLGGSNATTMSGFNFSGTSSGSGTGFNSTGKVQFVVQGTNTDQVKLVPLQLDGVLDAAGEPGNLGLAGQWTSIGLTNIGGVAYQVYNHSTTQAQVLVSNATVQMPSNPQTVAITSAAISSTSFVQEFVAPQVATTKAQKSVTTDDGNWTISATGANGQTLPTIADNNGNVGYYVSIGERWTGLPTTELNLGEQTTQTLAGGRREYKFTSNTGPFDFVAFNYTDVNFTNDLWINFYNASGQLIDRTAFTASGANNSFFTYNIKDAGLATSFMIDTSTDDTWGMDKLTTGVQQSAAEVASGASIMDATPLLKGTYSANLAVGEVIAVYDGATKLGNAVINADTKTWSYQTTSNLSVAAHTFTAKVETAGGTATSTSSNFSLTLLSSPLALDLNGDGVQTMGIEQGVQFDLLATGSAQHVGWLDGQDGWLALDLDANGRIDSGAELLGSSTRLADGSQARDGWQALAQYDGNADGVIDARDEVFLDLKVWVDANSNGQTEAGELRTLADLQIVSLDLNHAGGEIAQNGNILQGLSSFTTADGQSHEMVDAWLKVDQVLNTAEATADAVPAGELLQLNQLLSAAPPAGALIEVLPVLDGSAHNAMLQSMLDLHAQNATQP